MTADEPDRFSFVDFMRSACLADVDLPGYAIAWCVNSAGEDQAWLISEAELNIPGTTHGDGDQPHEQLGPLPDRWRYRVALAPYRCGRPRADGRPCRQFVGEAGRTCAWHSERASAP